MLVSELSEVSGVSIHSIKYYVREGLMRPGVRTSRTRAEYNEDHVRELVLIRALIELRGLSVQAVGGILSSLRQGGTNFHFLLGYLVGSLDSPAEPETDSDQSTPTTASRGTLDELVALMGWNVHPGTKAMRDAEASLEALRRYGIPLEVDDLLRYAQASDEIARADFDHLSTCESHEQMFEHALIRTFLLDTTILSMRRLAQENLSSQMFTDDTDPRDAPSP